MTLQLELPPEMAQLLTREAARNGQDTAEFARNVLAERLGTTSQRERNQRAIALLDEWDREDEVDSADPGPPPAITPLSLREVDVG